MPSVQPRCPYDETCTHLHPCPHPDVCAWFVADRPGGHCAARDPDEVLLRYQIARQVAGTN